MEDQSNGKTLFTFVTARRVLIVLSIVAIAAFFTLITLYSERITAELGDTHAQFSLGVHYHDGDHGLPQDFAEAARWYHKAAEQGFAPAQNNLGALYWMGDGVPQDRAEAVRWHRKAAEQGDPNAQYNLGTSLAYGRGVPKDLQQAYVWLSLAVAQGDTKAHANQDFVASQLDRESIANAQRRAAEFVPKKQGKDILDTKR